MFDHFDPGKNGTRVIYVAKHVQMCSRMANRIHSKYIYVYTVVDVTSGRSASGNETNQVDVVSNKSVVGTCLPPEQDPQSHGAGS